MGFSLSVLMHIGLWKALYALSLMSKSWEPYPFNKPPDFPPDLDFQHPKDPRKEEPYWVGYVVPMCNTTNACKILIVNREEEHLENVKSDRR